MTYGTALLLDFLFLGRVGFYRFYGPHIVRLRLFFLLLFFPLVLHAGWRNSAGQNSMCFATKEESCQTLSPSFIANYTYHSTTTSNCVLHNNVNNVNQNFAFSSCNEACAAGQERYKGLCVAACPPGATRDGAGVCQCGDGQVVSGGACVCTPSLQGYPRTLNGSGQCVANCSTLSGEGFGTVFDPAGSYNGCKVNCQITVGSPWPLSCKYTGETAGDGSNTAPGLPQEGMPPPPQATPSADTCPAGTSPGFVNGQRYCAPNSPGGTTPPGETPPTRTASEETRVEQETTTTVNNPDGSTTTTRVVRTTTYGSNASSGSGSGEGGEGEGAGDCDPTADNYLDCVGSSTAPTHTETSAQTVEEAFSNFSNQLQQTQLVGAIGGMAGMFDVGPGECPSPSFSVFGQSFEIDMHCTLFESIASTISVLMMVIFTWLGLRVIASA